MKKLILLMLSLALVFALVACSQSEDAPADGDTGGDEGAADPVRIVNLVNGNFGDLSFFDSAKAGMDMVEAEYGDSVEVTNIEMGYDNTKWYPSILDAADEGYDIIIAGTWQVVEHIQSIADLYPDITFIIYDSSVNWDGGDYNNVHCIEYKQNEGSFLVGALAASMTESGKLGFLGGIDNDVIKDFLVGYVEGAQYVNPDVEIAVSYVGNFSDPATGKELSLAQYGQGIDVMYGAAGSAGMGMFEAAIELGGKDAGLYCLGVDSDQAMLFAGNDEVNKAEITLTSMLKRVDNSLFQAVTDYMNGELDYGVTDYVGLAEETIAIADNEYYQAGVPDDVKATIADISAKIQSGEIEVGTAFGLSIDDYNAMVDAVAIK